MRNVNLLQDDIEIVIGAWLIASPWLLGYAQPFTAAAASASVIGLAVLMFSLDDLFFVNEADEWADVTLGVALMLTPWMLGYTDNVIAMANAIASGLMVCGFAAWAIERLHAMAAGAGGQLPLHP